MTAHIARVVMGGLFHAAILFLVAAVQAVIRAGGPPELFVLPLAAAGLLAGLVGIVVERGLLRFIYDRDETFQLLLTFALVLMLEDLIRMTWGTAPVST